jgi:PDZ domain-containing secreted protein
MPEPDWDAPMTITMRRGNAAAVVQALGYANNLNDESIQGRVEIKDALDSPGQPIPDTGEGTVEVLGLPFEDALARITWLVQASNPGQTITAERHHIGRDGKYFTVTVKPYVTGVQGQPDPPGEVLGREGGDR